MSAQPAAAVGMPDTLRPLYDEAAAIADASPASAAALLRLLLRALLQQAGRTGRHLSNDVATIVDEGGQVNLLRALDAIGLADSESRRPGEVNLANGHSDAQNLFMFVNLFTDQVLER